MLIVDRSAACQLASDLLQMYYDKNDTDTKIVTEDGELFAHKFVINQKKIEIKLTIKKK